MEEIISTIISISSFFSRENREFCVWTLAFVSTSFLIEDQKGKGGDRNAYNTVPHQPAFSALGSPRGKEDGKWGPRFLPYKSTF